MDKKTLTLIQREADKMWFRFCESSPRLVRFNPPSVTFNNRIYRVAGRCFVEENKVELSAKLWDAKKENRIEILRVTLPHELAHQIDVNLNGTPKNNRWHGATWSKIMVNYGLPANPYHSMDII